MKDTRTSQMVIQLHDAVELCLCEGKGLSTAKLNFRFTYTSEIVNQRRL